MEPAYRYKAECVRVIDGDSYHLRIDLGFRCSATVPVRLRGVNCPELGTEGGKIARDWVTRLLTPTPYPAENPPLVVESYRDRQSFARWVCDIWVEGSSLADLLVANGHGVPV